MKRERAKNILITGATSGIGEAVALEFARQGAAHLFLCGRNAERLATVVEKCIGLGAETSGEIIDVSDSAAVAEWILKSDKKAPLDLVFANAGVGIGGEENSENTRSTFDINVGGVLNTVLPAIEIFSEAGSETRNRRQIAITSSMTGYHGLPTCPAYSATKACVKAWGAGLRGSLRPRGIMVNTICPGFVRSRLTDKNKFKMPFFWEADKAARVIVSRLNRDIGLISFPWQMRFACWLGGSLPERVSSWIYGLVKVEL